MYETATTTVHIICPFCRKKHCVKNIPVRGFDRWRNGELIQRALPNLTLTQREQLVSNLCPDCQVKVFGW